MSELFSIFRSVEPIGDVIFVHGLGGDAHETWGFPDKSAWLQSINIARPDLNIWSLGYRVDVSEWTGGAMPLSDRAINILALLDIRLSENRPIIFVCHSLGGLLVKELLRNALTTTPRYKRMAEKVKLIVFFATPHSGSGVADLAGYLKFFLRNSIAVSDLTAQNPRLRDLNLWFRNNFASLDLKTLIFFETKKTRGVQVVNETSADPGIAPISPIPIDADHLDITKATKSSDIAIGQTLLAFDAAVPSSKHRFRYEDVGHIQAGEVKRSTTWAWKKGNHLSLRTAVRIVGIIVAVGIAVYAAVWWVTPDLSQAVLYTSGGRYSGKVEWQYELVTESRLATPLSIMSGLERKLTPVPAVKAVVKILDALEANIVIQKATHTKVKTSKVGEDGKKEDTGEYEVGGAHLIEIVFHLPEKFHGGAVGAVKSIAVKRREGQEATNLYITEDKFNDVCGSLLPCKPAEISKFYAYLSPDPKITPYNNWNMHIAGYFEISLTFADKQPGTVVIETGSAGTHAIFRSQIDWGEYPSEAPKW
jgi:pimeloyl-ACP methyl ester carboxylesterase